MMTSEKYRNSPDPVKLEGIEAIHSHEAERALLGSILSQPQEVMDEAGQLDYTDFFNPAHQELFKCLKEMYQDKRGIDLSTVMQYLEDRKILDAIGGPAMLGDLAAGVVSAMTAPSHVRTIKEKSILHRLTLECARVIVNCRDNQHDFEGVKSHAESLLTRVFDKAQSRRYRTAHEVMIDFVRERDEIETKGLPSGLMTGIESIDRLTTGFKDGDLVVIGARTAVGKTALLLSIFRNISRSMVVESEDGSPPRRITPGYCTAIHPLEMKDVGLAQRFVAMEAGIDMQKFRQNKLSAADKIAMASAASEIAGWPMFFDDSFSQSMSSIASKARGLKRKYGKKFKALGIDQLTLLKPSEKNDNRREQVCAMTRSAKDLAMELDIVVFLLAQINRKSEEKENKEPQLHELKESGSIEEDADVVLLLSRDTKKNFPDSPQYAICNVAKQRNGPTDRIQIGYKQSVTQWADLPRTAK